MIALKAHISTSISVLSASLAFILEADLLESVSALAAAVAAGFAAYHYFESARLKRAERKRLEKEN